MEVTCSADVEYDECIVLSISDATSVTYVSIHHYRPLSSCDDRWCTWSVCSPSLMEVVMIIVCDCCIQSASISAVILWSCCSAIFDIHLICVHRCVIIQWYPFPGHHDLTVFHACSACDPRGCWFLGMEVCTCLHKHTTNYYTVSCCWVSYGKPWHEKNTLVLQ